MYKEYYKEYLTRRPIYIFDNISFISSWNENCFGKNL